MKDQDKEEISQDERTCQKCETIVHKSDFNEYYGLCDYCVENCGMRH